MTQFSAFIYGLKNPLTNEVFYIGCTKHSIRARLNTHYFALTEVETGRRVMNKRLQYLKDLLPTRCEIFLIEEVDEEDMYNKEVEYIKFYKELGYNLVNGTIGGKGNHTTLFFTDEEKKVYGEKISKGNSGVKRTDEYKKNLSDARWKGDRVESIVCFFEDKKICQMFEFGFQANTWFKKRVFGNIIASMKRGKEYGYSNGYYWKKYSDLSEEEKIVAANTLKELE